MKKKTTSLGLEPIEILPKGRKNKIKRFLGGESDLKRLAKKTPEAIVKVSGGGKTVQHVIAHLTYITRNGKLEAENDESEKLTSKDELRELMDEWGLDIAKGIGENKLVFNVVLSMPVGTDAGKLHTAAKNFARDRFYGERQYLMVLHEPQTDPSKKKAEHPHVHLVIKAQGYNGRRLYIRKATLQEWREQFAEKLREQGIEANATPRWIRGVVRKTKKPAVYRIDQRAKSDILIAKFEEVRKEIDRGVRAEKPWDEAIKKQRAALVENLANTAKDYRIKGNIDLATALEEFVTTLPPVMTERDEMREILHSVKGQRKSAEPKRDSAKDKASHSKTSQGGKDLDKGRA